MSDNKGLDPDARHTVLDMIDGGVRIQPIKVSGDEALAWARKNKVDLSQPGDRESIINSARIARNLPPYKITSPPTPPAPPPVTRDGAPSVAAAQQVHEARPGDVDMRVPLEWAKANRIIWDRVTPKFIDQINEERRRLKLPMYRVKPKPGGAAIVTPGQAALSRLPVAELNAEPIVSTIAAERGDEARWKGLPTNAAELYDMATSFVGVVSGLVTPALAELLLQMNTENRNLNDKAVSGHVQAIVSGRWINDGNPIKIATNAVLNDGQHRLSAVAKSGTAVHMDLRFGVPREAFTVTDTGMRRTNGQILAMAGRQYSTMQSALCRLLVRYDQGEMQRLYDGVDGDVVVAMTESNPDIGRVAALLRALKFKPIKNGAFGFVLVAAARKIGFEKAEEFAKLVDSGQGADDSPTRRLHVRLMEAALSKTVRLRPIDNCVMVAVSWNAWITGKPIQVLRVGETHRTGPGFPKLVFGPAAKSEPPAGTE